MSFVQCFSVHNIYRPKRAHERIIVSVLLSQIYLHANQNVVSQIEKFHAIIGTEWNIVKEIA